MQRTRLLRWFTRALDAGVLLCVAVSAPFFGPSILAQRQAVRVPRANYDVVWSSPGRDHRDSMPIGNGDLSANVWTEANGDVLLLIGKSDAWSENGQLLKLGQVRLSFSPSPFFLARHFTQTLQVRAGKIVISSGEGTVVQVWVDANRPAMHFEWLSQKPLVLKTHLELWRTQPRTISSDSKEAKLSLWELAGGPSDIVLDADMILPARNNAVRWGHRNERSIFPETFRNQHLAALLPRYSDPLLYRTSGMLMEGTGLRSQGSDTLVGASPALSGRVNLYPLVAQTSSVESWSARLDDVVRAADPVPIAQARRAHDLWWRRFWQRSWIDVRGDADADAVTQGYAMQRYMLAASSRGEAPPKFNGGAFTIGDINSDGKLEEKPDARIGRIDPDYRRWGSNYWFQNERHLYWPLLATGDTDLMLPFFRLYRQALPLEQDRVGLYFNHPGAIFPETIHFWGTQGNADFGWENPDVVMINTYIRLHVNSGLELTQMMLDRYEERQDKAFARQYLIPIAAAVTTYFDKHWQRAQGHILFDPSQSLETDRPSVNPMPDVAGLHAVLPRLLGLPQDITLPEIRAQWTRMLTELPPLPRGHSNAHGKHPEPETEADPAGTPILWTAERWTPSANGKPGNSENPELYAVFPYRLFGVGMPELQLARNTFYARRNAEMTCWSQNGIDAAALGLAAEARRHVVANFTDYSEERFRWFWAKGHDWEPDLDNGGAGMTTLQTMLLQPRGKKLIVTPAWPKQWDVTFKLYAPKNTIIQGTYRNGNMVQLRVTPESRAADVVLMPAQ